MNLESYLIVPGSAEEEEEEEKKVYIARDMAKGQRNPRKEFPVSKDGTLWAIK